MVYMKPNWLQSRRSIIAGFRSHFITASSAILLSVEVRYIGLRSLLTSITCLSFGIGQILANFQQAGTGFSLNDVFIIVEIGIARITAYSTSLRTSWADNLGHWIFPA